MLIQLLSALMKTLKFRDIDPKTICMVDDKVGFIWFKADDTTYSISIEETDFDLEEINDQSA